MNLKAGLHHFLFQIEEHFGESRLLLGQSKDGLIHHFDTQCGLHALAFTVGHAKTDARFPAGFVDLSVRRGLDAQFIGGLHKDHPMIADGPPVVPEHIRIQLHRAGHPRRGGKLQLRAAVHDVEVMSGNRLSILNHVDVRAALRTSAQHLQTDSLARSIQRLLRHAG